MKARLIQPASIPEDTEVTSFEDIQNLVGGFVTVVRKPGQTYFLDEDGIPKRLQQNSVASLEMGMSVYGPVVAMHHVDAKEILG